jgi:hypothetical protein
MSHRRVSLQTQTCLLIGASASALSGHDGTLVGHLSKTMPVFRF